MVIMVMSLLTFKEAINEIKIRIRYRFLSKDLSEEKYKEILKKIDDLVDLVEK